jgi:hypothetical protein
MKWAYFCFGIVCAWTYNPLALGHSRQNIPWVETGAPKLVDAFLESYTTLFFKFPRAFSPYHFKKTNLDRKDLWKHLCKKNMKKICANDNEFKIRFKDIYGRIQNKDEENLDADTKFQQSLKELQTTVEKLRGEYSEFYEQYKVELQNILMNPSHFTNLKSINAALTDLRSLLKDSIDQYKKAYEALTTHYPNRLLSDSTFQNLVEGQRFDVEEIDIIHAVTAITKRLKDQLNADLNSLAETPPLLETYSLWNEHLFFYEPKLNSSLISIPDVTSTTVLETLRQFSNNDAMTFDAILRHSYQTAVWRLKDLGQTTLALRFENFIENRLLTSENLLDIKKLGGGAGTSYVAKFKDGLRCVYKPSGFSIEKPVDFFITSSKYEVAASVIDRMIGLNQVPLTVLKKFGDFHEGSCQYFAENTLRARDMLKYDGTRPGKFDSSRGRATKSKDVLFFDGLIDNFDRNMDNYLVAYDGRIVLIDHGFSFKLPLPLPLSWVDLEAKLPSPHIYHRLVELDKNPQVLKEALKSLLSTDEIWVLKSKIHSVIKLIQKHGVYNQTSSTDLKMSLAS